MRYLPVTTSTQAQVKDALDRGTKAPLFVITEEQTAGRGRLDRTWTAPPFSSVLMSVGLPLSGQPSTFTLHVGVAVAEALAVQGVQVLLKWPNDIVVVRDGRVRKLGGILAEVHRDHVVVGIGLNIDLDDDELPTPDAISCRQLGNTPRRERLIDDIVDGLSTLPLGASLAEYRRLSATIGADVAVSTLAGAPIVGTAIDVDTDGALLVREPNGVEHRITVGDVRHVRPGAET
jgi:BirA family biotin operon repressor/biotin-[acetyl-CoA-carboxylase] ligase